VALMLATPAFAPGGEIPTQYTCDGADVSPALTWSGVPPGSKSLVLIVEDPDAPSGLFMHWAAYDIPSAMNGLPAGYGGSRPGGGFREGRNDFGTEGYRGPVAGARTIIYFDCWRSAGQGSIWLRPRAMPMYCGQRNPMSSSKQS